MFIIAMELVAIVYIQNRMEAYFNCTTLREEFTYLFLVISTQYFFQKKIAQPKFLST